MHDLNIESLTFAFIKPDEPLQTSRHWRQTSLISGSESKQLKPKLSL